MTSNTSHVVKIGHSVEKISKRTGKPYKGPGKLNGFLICRDTRDTDGNFVVDEKAMLRLGKRFDAKAIAEAKQKEFDARDGILPRELHFAIPSDSTRVPGNGWEHPGTFTEGYQCWTKEGLLCSGDGEQASRKQGNGTQRQGPCVPVGKEGAAPKTFCSESVAGDCKHKCRLTLSLFVVGENGEPEPLSRSLSWSARYRLETTSEAAAMRAGEELDRAAELLDGHLHGITGVLVFARQSKRTGKVKIPVGITGQIMFMLSEPDIARREQQLHNRYVEQRQAKLLEGPADNPFEETQVGEGVTPEEVEEVLGEGAEEPNAEPEPEAKEPELPEATMATEEQIEEIEQLSDAYEVDILALLKEKGIDAIAHLPFDHAEAVIEWLNKTKGVAT